MARSWLDGAATATAASAAFGLPQVARSARNAASAKAAFGGAEKARLPWEKVCGQEHYTPCVASSPTLFCSAIVDKTAQFVARNGEVAWASGLSLRAKACACAAAIGTAQP